MTIYIVDLEAVDTRYTKEWKTYLPRQLKKATCHQVVTISGGDTPQATTPGAFLNFGGTNVYKANQMQQIGKLFCDGKVKDGDYFLYTDAWNPTVLQLKYMAELLKVKIKHLLLIYWFLQVHPRCVWQQIVFKLWSCTCILLLDTLLVCVWTYCVMKRHWRWRNLGRVVVISVHLDFSHYQQTIHWVALL